MPQKRHSRGTLGIIIGVLLGMVGVWFGGFAAGLYLLAPHFLHPSEVQQGKPRPIRILSPDEAAAVAKDEPSHVWTEGVKPEDIPKLEPDQTTDKSAPRKHRKHAAASAPTTATPDAPAANSAPTDAGTDTAPAPDGTPDAAPPTGEPVSPD